ncbi:tetracycline 6-hydroxylase protein [Polychaeton citri CBS 116435]|uniref:Tetracycline 6-hydroxylase protein n=1 Tax=Polychaeton citri CBS 116435 TaxID=1314669 RepID=A0A9P4QIF5_9PEZI|nr:tetracycline 6-hydroxylase protein [Polychaeton citri CBS 116435]
MQFHLNGFVGSRDPLLPNPDAPKPDYQTSLPSEVDVLIVGAGPAGQLLATQLSRFPDISTRIIETKPSRLEQGQADGLQCRTIEIFEAFGFADKVIKEAYWVNETTFWSPGEEGKGVVRTGRIRDTEDGLSEFPHVILNQARLHDLWLERMGKSESKLEPTYLRRLVGLKIPEDVGERVEVKVEKLDSQSGEPTGRIEDVKARFVVGCDGARSAVRTSLGYEMEGDFANQAWGVMDALVVTDFPDIRLKTTMHSANEGSVIIIPREGGYLVRLYIGLDKLGKGERASNKNMTADILVDRAQKIFAPFKLDVREVAYWSVYEVGQRLTSHFDDCPPSSSSATANGTTTAAHTRHPRVFIAGDACHTHSAKAGQGMNVSMNDTYNLGWKIAAVLHGTCHPSPLLQTYNAERQPLAKLLIDFDRRIAALSAAKPKKQTGDPEEDAGTIDPATFQEYFTRQGRFMAGVETTYAPSAITSGDATHQHLATGFKIGQRFHSAQVLRLADAKPIHLGHVIEADGRFRLFIFGSNAEDPTSKASALWQTCTFLLEEVIGHFTPEGWDADSVIDVRCVLPQRRHSIEGGIMAVHPLLMPQKGKLGLQDYEKTFTDEESYGFGGGKFYAERGIDVEKGAILAVRPDQYIAGVWPLDEDAWDGIREYFAGFMVDRRQDREERKVNGSVA